MRKARARRMASGRRGSHADVRRLGPRAQHHRHDLGVARPPVRYARRSRSARLGVCASSDASAWSARAAPASPPGRPASCTRSLSPSIRRRLRVRASSGRERLRQVVRPLRNTSASAGSCSRPVNASDPARWRTVQLVPTVLALRGTSPAGSRFSSTPFATCASAGSDSLIRVVGHDPLRLGSVLDGHRVNPVEPRHRPMDHRYVPLPDLARGHDPVGARRPARHGLPCRDVRRQVGGLVDEPEVGPPPRDPGLAGTVASSSRSTTPKPDSPRVRL